MDLYFFARPNQLRKTMNAQIVQAQTRAPRRVTLDLRVTLPAGTPMLDVAQAMTQLAAAVRGTWSYRQPAGADHGRFEVESQS